MDAKRQGVLRLAQYINIRFPRENRARLACSDSVRLLHFTIVEIHGLASHHDRVESVFLLVSALAPFHFYNIGMDW